MTHNHFYCSTVQFLYHFSPPGRTMTNITLITALISTFMSFSACTFHTACVEVGDDISLQCTNVSILPLNIFWFKLTDGSNASNVASMSRPNSDVRLYERFQNGKFNLSSNSTTLILTIKGVDFSESGLYFCGYREKRYLEIYSATSLMVKEKSNGGIMVIPLILGALITVLIGVIAGLVVKIWKLQIDGTATTNEDMSPDDLNYSSIDFQRVKRSRRTPPKKEPESHPVYAATR
uniref:Ig-like domain-containing protein n=1 Tax=Takifugu rubripes TaxID=31033 RepID=A0A3B5KMW7_TAKRU